MKVNKTGIKEYEKETGILPAGVEKVENWSLRIKEPALRSEQHTRQGEIQERFQR